MPKACFRISCRCTYTELTSILPSVVLGQISAPDKHNLGQAGWQGGKQTGGQERAFYLLQTGWRRVPGAAGIGDEVGTKAGGGGEAGRGRLVWGCVRGMTDWRETSWRQPAEWKGEEGWKRPNAQICSCKTSAEDEGCLLYVIKKDGVMRYV